MEKTFLISLVYINCLLKKGTKGGKDSSYENILYEIVTHFNILTAKWKYFTLSRNCSELTR